MEVICNVGAICFFLLFFGNQLHLIKSEPSPHGTILSHSSNPFGFTATSLLTANSSENAIEVSQMASRSKRGVLHLYNMVSCATGCDPLKYKGYGCYCGFLGSGYAVDGIDRCCQYHDWCYNSAGCPMFLVYFIPYYWKCHRRKPLCAVTQTDWGACAYRLCECDRLLSECLRKYPCPKSRALCTSSPLRLLQNAFMIL